MSAWRPSRFWLASTNSARKIASSDTVIVRNGNGNGSNGRMSPTPRLTAIQPFDPFPFPFLTMMVSLEAIFLSLFVLASQNRLAARPTSGLTSICRSICWRSAR